MNRPEELVHGLGVLEAMQSMLVAAGAEEAAAASPSGAASSVAASKSTQSADRVSPPASPADASANTDAQHAFNQLDWSYSSHFSYFHYFHLDSILFPIPPPEKSSLLLEKLVNLKATNPFIRKMQSWISLGVLWFDWTVSELFARMIAVIENNSAHEKVLFEFSWNQQDISY